MTDTHAWDRILQAAELVETQEVLRLDDTRNLSEPVAWFLRREAGLAAYRFSKLKGEGVPTEHALSLAIDDSGFIIADSMALSLLNR